MRKRNGARGIGMAMMAAAILLLVHPAAASKVALNEAELDGVSAGGQSTIIMSGDSSPIEYTDNSQFNLVFDVPDAQVGFRALTIQNVVGELQLLVNLNVLSANGSVASTDQRNFSLQSWGGTLPIADTVATVPGVSASNCTANNSCQVSGNGGDLTSKAGDGGSGSVEEGAITGQNGGVANNSGNGGAGSSQTVGNASTSPGLVSEAKSASGDLVIVAGSNGSTVKAVDDSQFNLSFTASQAQSDLAALFISNVVGRSQMALNLNIASSVFTTLPFQANAIGGDVTGTIKQVNTGIQFRGTPLVGSSGVTTGVNVTVNHQNQ